MTVVKSKLVKKLALLFALSLSLAYLHKPDALYATSFQQCIQNCQNQLTACDKACKGNKLCLDGCANNFEGCIRNCHP
jgi:hypothetical protein